MANTIDTDAKIIAADQYGFGQPALCRCSSTLMFAAHINDSSQLEIHKSIDDGTNWSLVKTFSETSPDDFEMAAIDSASAAITFNHANGIKVYVTINNGVTWIEKRTFGDSVENYKPNIAYDSIEGRLWFVFYRHEYGYSRIIIDYSNDKGDNWVSNYYHNVSMGGTATAVDIDINPLNSKVYVITAQPGSAQGYKVIFSKTGSQESIVGVMNSILYDTCIILDSSGNDFVISGAKFYSPDGYHIVQSKNGDTIGNDNKLLDGEGLANYSDLVIPGSVSVAVDGDDNIYAFYTKDSDEKTYYRKYNGSTWESETILVGVANDRISCEKRPISGSNELHYVYYKAP